MQSVFEAHLFFCVSYLGILPPYSRPSLSQTLGTLHLGQYLSFSDSCPSISIVPPFLCLKCPTELIACFLVGHEASICHVASIYHVSFNSHTTAPGVPPACSSAGNQSGYLTLSNESLCSPFPPLRMAFSYLYLPKATYQGPGQTVP